MGPYGAIWSHYVAFVCVWGGGGGGVKPQSLSHVGLFDFITMK